jgi:hypothetical protein
MAYRPTPLEGPASFAFDTPQAPDQLQPGQAVEARDGVIGSPTTGDQTYGITNAKAAPIDPGVALLIKHGDDAINKQLDKAKQGEFVRGMQLAMQGVAIQDIAKERPWFARIFGDGDAVEGARAYYGNTQAQLTAAAMTDAMPELRKMNSAEAQDFFQKAVLKNMTGDDAADLSIMKGLTQALPGVMRQQVKEHYAYKQEQATEAESKSFQAGALALQKQGLSLAQGMTNDEDFGTAQDLFARSLFPPQGRDIKSWQEARKANLIDAANNGQFHAINALVKHGFLETLTPDQKVAVQSAIESAASRQRSKYTADWSAMVADVKIHAMHPKEKENPQQIMERGIALNQRFQKETGNPLGIFSPDELTALGTGSADAIYQVEAANLRKLEANARSAATAQQKAELQAQKAAKIDDFISGAISADGNPAPHGIKDLLADSTVTPQEINAQMIPRYKALPPEQQPKLLTGLFLRDKYVNEPISNNLDAEVAAVSRGAARENFGDEANRVYAKWKAMNDVSPGAAAAYYPEYGKRMAQFDQLTGQGVSLSVAWAEAMSPLPPAAPLDPKVLKKSVASAHSQAGDLLPSVLGGKQLRDEASLTLGHLIGESAREIAGRTGDMDNALKVAYKRDAATGMHDHVGNVVGKFELGGQYAWKNREGTISLQSYLTTTGALGHLAAPTDRLDDVVDGAFEQALYGDAERQGVAKKYTLGHPFGGNLAHVLVDKAPDTTVYGRHVPRFTLIAYDNDGQTYTATVSGDDMLELYSRSKKRKAESEHAAADAAEAQRLHDKQANDLRLKDTQDHLRDIGVLK